MGIFFQCYSCILSFQRLSGLFNRFNERDHNIFQLKHIFNDQFSEDTFRQKGNNASSILLLLPPRLQHQRNLRQLPRNPSPMQPNLHEPQRTLLLHTLTHIPVDKSTLGVHQIKLVIQTGPSLSNGCGVTQHTHGTLNLSQVTTRNNCGRLVVDANLKNTITFHISYSGPQEYNTG